jgi:hypothetical protein
MLWGALTEIERAAFIPTGLNSIGGESKGIKIPSTVREIRKCAFAYSGYSMRELAFEFSLKVTSRRLVSQLKNKDLGHTYIGGQYLME